jgi:hypothetical protein
MDNWKLIYINILLIVVGASNSILEALLQGLLLSNTIQHN